MEKKIYASYYIHVHAKSCCIMYPSVTKLGDLLHFGQLFKAFGNNYFAQIAHI